MNRFSELHYMALYRMEWHWPYDICLSTGRTLCCFYYLHLLHFSALQSWWFVISIGVYGVIIGIYVAGCRFKGLPIVYWG